MSLIEFFFYLTFLNWSIVTLLWFHCKKKNSLNLLGVFWGIGIVLIGWSAFILETLLEDPSLNLRQLLSNMLLTLWGLRLSIYIYKRQFWEHEDPRFLRLKKKINGKWTFSAYKKIFLYLGFFQLIVIAPIISTNFIPGPKSLNFLDFLGIIIFFVGFLVENRADKDLSVFRKLPDKELKVLNKGLWGYCRHPNYLGDILQWWGLYFLACSATGGVWSFYGPLIMTLFFLKISIRDIEERLIIQRPGYINYIESTNKLIPKLKIPFFPTFAKLQLLIPHNFFTSIAGYLSKSENFLLKSFLISVFCYIYKPNLEECKRKNKRDYKSFNDFFSRKLKSESRIVNLEKTKLISPVDGMITSFGQVNLGTLIQAKGMKYELNALFEDKNLIKKYENGSFVTIYLAPTNYHRIHCPFSGVIKKTKYFPGNLYSVNPSSLKTIDSLYTKNERALIYVESEKIDYCLISVGASMVGSIIPFWMTKNSVSKREIISAWNRGPHSDSLNIKKGEEIGYFTMGSTVILLIPETIQLNNNFLYESKSVKFGEILIDLL